MTDTATGPRPSPGKTYGLVPHPDMPAGGVEAFSVEMLVSGDELHLTYVVHGDSQVALPNCAASKRTDGLWKTTCCELFLAPAGSESYFEFNYSPSTQWAAYRFEAYRAGGCDLPLAVAPVVARGGDASVPLVTVRQPLSDLPPGPLAMSLTAVIEESDGTKSYWALAHAPGPPDFHNRTCFVATLSVPPHP